MSVQVGKQEKSGFTFLLEKGLHFSQIFVTHRINHFCVQHLLCSREKHLLQQNDPNDKKNGPGKGLNHRPTETEQPSPASPSNPAPLS